METSHLFQAMMIVEELCDAYDNIKDVSEALQGALKLFEELKNLPDTQEIMKEVRKRFEELKQKK